MYFLNAIAQRRFSRGLVTLGVDDLEELFIKINK